MLIDLSETAVRTALRHFEGLFSHGDVEAILESFTDDVEVRYALFAPFTGKERLRQLLRQRFAAMRDYRLSKRLEFLSAPHIAASWSGSWIDVRTNARMELFGIEVLTVRDGRFCQWSAGVSAWRSDETTSPADQRPGEARRA